MRMEGPLPPVSGRAFATRRRVSPQAREEFCAPARSRRLRSRRWPRCARPADGVPAALAIYRSGRARGLRALGHLPRRDRSGEVLRHDAALVVKVVLLSAFLHTGFSCRKTSLGENRFGLYAISSGTPVNRLQSTITLAVYREALA